MCFGTFDRLHPGHLYYLKEAKKEGDYLIVVVARDRNVHKLKDKWPKENQRFRCTHLRAEKVADKVVLGKRHNRYWVIKKYKPNIIALGYDQIADEEKIKTLFNLEIKRISSYFPEKYKSSKLD